MTELLVRGPKFRADFFQKEQELMQRPAQTYVDARPVADPDERHRRIVEMQVRFQLANLRTFDCVVRALKADLLELHGWVLDVGTGRVWSDNPVSEEFDMIV